MQIKCDYCGSFISDTDSKCPNCGAVNGGFVRSVNDSPRTIEELQNWYRDRNLPPKEVTRFFIGINTHEAKAFGIYEDCGEYIVYKNKADGTRAVRYRGTDQAYAVNEIYTRLKEEILNQKNHNVSANTRSTYGGASAGGDYRTSYGSSDSSGSYSRRNYRASYEKTSSNKVGKIIGWVVVAFVLLGFIIPYLADEFSGSNSYNNNYSGYNDYYDRSSWYVTCTPTPVPLSIKTKSYYFDIDNTLYYYDGYEYYDNDSSGWWIYQPESENWIRSNESITYYDQYINGLTLEDAVGTLSDLKDVLVGMELLDEHDEILDSPYNVQNCREFLDAKHTTPSRPGYYVKDSKTYYYYNGSDYSQASKYDGWYVYDNGWQYFTSGNNKEELGEELWYNDDEYRVGTNYDEYKSGDVFYFDDDDSWDSSMYASDFNTSDWYSKSKINSYSSGTTTDPWNSGSNWWDNNSSSSGNSSSWDNDWGSSSSSWDWDSGSSWDSGWSDWDSDW